MDTHQSGIHGLARTPRGARLIVPAQARASEGNEGHQFQGSRYVPLDGYGRAVGNVEHDVAAIDVIAT